MPGEATRELMFFYCFAWRLISIYVNCILIFEMKVEVFKCFTPISIYHLHFGQTIEILVFHDTVFVYSFMALGQLDLK